MMKYFSINLLRLCTSFKSLIKSGRIVILSLERAKFRQQVLYIYTSSFARGPAVGSQLPEIGPHSQIPTFRDFRSAPVLDA